MTGNSYLLRLISFCCIAQLMISSCAEDKLIQNAIPREEYDTIAMLPVGGEESVMFVSSGDWSITAPNWLTCSPKSGKAGVHEIKLSADVNRTRADRSGQLQFVCKNTDDNKEITILQPAPYLDVEIIDASGSALQDDVVMFEWNKSEENNAASYSLRIKSNVDWHFSLDEETDSDNFALSSMSGSGNATVKLFTKKNNIDKIEYLSSLSLFGCMSKDSDERIGDGVNSYIWSLIQENLRFLINGECDPIGVFIDEMNDNVVNGTLRIDSECPWRIDNAGWVEVSAKKGPEGISTLELKADGVNPERTQRAFDVKIISEGGAERTIYVVQDPYRFSIDKKSVSFNNEGNKEQTIQISSSSAWEIRGTVPSWLSVEPLYGIGDATVKVTCLDQNLNLTDNIFPLTIASTHNSLSEVANIKQDKFVFDVTPDDNIARIPNQSTLRYDVDISSSGPWRIESSSPSEDWVFVSQNNGVGNNTIKVGAKTANPSEFLDRVVKLRLISVTHENAGKTLVKEFDVLQTKFIFEINLDKTTIPAYTEDKLYVDIKCSSNWEITSCPSWLKPDISNGEFDKRVGFTILPNANKTTRSGKIAIRSIYNNKTEETSRIAQDAFVFSSENSSFSNIPPVTGSSQCVVSLSCSDGAPWIVTSDCDWIKKPSSGSGSAEIAFVIDNNLSSSKRSGTAIIESSVSADKIEIGFNQDGFVFDINASDAYSFNELNVPSTYFDINCSDRWTLISSASWVHFDEASGMGNHKVKMDVDNNVTLSDREATIQVISDLHKKEPEGLGYSFKVRQDRYVFDITPASHDFGVFGEKTDILNVTGSCSGNWHLESVPSWVKVSSERGQGDYSITVQAAGVNNSTSQKNSTSFYIVSDDSSSLRRLINVSQDHLVFKVDKDKYEIPRAGGSATCRLTCTKGLEWSCSSTDSWIKVDKTSGSGDATIGIKVDRGKGRTGSVVIKDKYDNKIIVTVSQKTR